VEGQRLVLGLRAINTPPSHASGLSWHSEDTNTLVGVQERLGILE
jgi:hypothetical protein